MDSESPPAPNPVRTRKQIKRRIPESWDIFAGYVASGDPLVDAYRKTFKNNKGNPNTIKKDASLLARRIEVATLIDKYKREEIQGCLLSRDERLQILGQIAKSKSSKGSEKVSAILAYTKIVGDAAPERQELDFKGQISASMTHTDLTVEARAAELMRQLEADDPTKP